MSMNSAGFIDGSIARGHLGSAIPTPYAQSGGEAAAGGESQRGSAEGGSGAADCCWIFLATTDCSTAQLNGLASLSRRAAAGDCCWILVATTGCSTQATVEGSGSKRPELAADCCWILVATTGCSTADRDSLTHLFAAGGPSRGASAQGVRPQSPPSASCCWVIVATTDCTT